MMTSLYAKLGNILRNFDSKVKSSFVPFFHWAPSMDFSVSPLTVKDSNLQHLSENQQRCQLKFATTQTPVHVGSS